MIFVLILHWHEFILSCTLLLYVSNLAPLVCHCFYYFLTYMLKLPCKWDPYHLALTQPYFIYFLIFIIGLPFFPFSFRMATRKRSRRHLHRETDKSICKIFGEKRQLEQPVHLHISACTEDGAIFKCSRYRSPWVSYFFSTPIFYFLCLFIVAFAYLIACLFDFMHLVTTWLK